MGSRMAHRLLTAGFPLIVWNRSTKAVTALAANGASIAGDPAAAAAAADLVLAMLTDDGASRTVWQQALPAMRPGSLAIEASTLTPSHVAELAAAVQARGATLLEMPVMGSRPQAEVGQLIGLPTGTRRDLTRALPVLQAFTGRLVEVAIADADGAPAYGSSARIKLAANAFFATQVAAIAELLVALGRGGFPPARAIEVLAQLPITAPPLALAGRAIANDQHAPQFPLDLVAKDLRYQRAEAAPSDDHAPLLQATLAQVERAIARGHGGRHITAVALALPA